MTATAEPGTVERLRAWAKGSLPLEASIELLIRAFDGRFARASQPWIRVEPSGTTWLDDQFLASSLGGLSGGERRVLTVVVALADTTGSRRVDLADVVAGIDRDNLDLVLATLAHAGGSHQDGRFVSNAGDEGAHLEPLASLHAWPAPAPVSPTAGTCLPRTASRSAPLER